MNRTIVLKDQTTLGFKIILPNIGTSSLLHAPGADASLNHGIQPSHVQLCKDENRKENVARKVQAHQFYQITKHTCCD